MTHPLAKTLVLTFLLAPAALAQVDRGRTIKTPTGDAAGVQRVSCVIQLDFDTNRGARTFDVQTLNALLTSTALLDPAAKKAMNLSPEEWPKVAQVELLPAGQYAVRVGVTLTSDAKLPPSAAQEFLQNLTASAKAAVEQSGSRSEKAIARRIDSAEKDVVTAQARYDAASTALATTPRNFNNGDTDFRLIGRNGSADRSALELLLVGQRARLRVLDQELANLRPSTQPSVPPVGPLDGTTPTAFNTSTVFDRFNAERISLRSNVAENEAKLDELNKRAAAQPPSTGPTTAPTPMDYERAQMEQSNARQALQQAQNTLESARREAQNVGGGVRLLVLDGRTNLD